MNKRSIKYLIIKLISIFTMKEGISQNISKETIIAKDEKPIDFYFIKHGSVYFTYDSIVFYVDPVSYPNVNYEQLPKADYILITHDHYDHFDTNAIRSITKPATAVICNQEVKKQWSQSGIALENYEQLTAQKVVIKALPAYNTTPGREIYHPKGRGDNGYLINIGGTSIYFAGDCEDMIEMENIGRVDIAFLPINQPYTMTVEQAIHAVKMVHPEILFPYHYGETDLKGLDVLKEMGMKVIIKPM